MTLDQLTSWPILLPVEVTDEELNALTEDNIRQKCERLLKTKRVPTAYKRLEELAGIVADRLNEKASSLEGHLARQENRKQWQRLGMVLQVQSDWMLKNVKVSADEVNWLVHRWLELKYFEPPRAQGVQI